MILNASNILALLPCLSTVSRLSMKCLSNILPLSANIQIKLLIKKCFIVRYPCLKDIRTAAYKSCQIILNICMPTTSGIEIRHLILCFISKAWIDMTDQKMFLSNQ